MKRYRRLGMFAAVVTVLVGLTGMVAAQETGYVLKWYSFTGGGVSTGGGYTLQASLGEAVAGVSSGGGMTMVIGAPPTSGAFDLLPDLVVESMVITLETDGACFYPPSQLGLRIRVANRGTAASGSSVLEVNGSTRVTVGALAQGASTSLWIPTYSVGDNTAVIDVDNQIVESNENNNRLTMSLPIPTPPPTCSSVDDAFEPDNTCATARTIHVGGLAQSHTLGDQNDEDWVQFQARAGVLYRMDAAVHQGSTVDLILEGYLDCEGVPDKSDNGAFGAGGRIDWRATEDSIFWLRILPGSTSGFGPNARYELSVSSIDESVQPGALIIVAGKYQNGDNLAPNIRKVAQDVYNAFTAYGYDNNSIYLISSDTILSSTLPGALDAPATNEALRNAITGWALSRIGPDRALTLYMVDHGGSDVFYLDRPNGQTVTTQQLDGWLDQVTQARPEASVNVILEACKAGSFINGNASLSGPNRVIITSTNDRNLAYASRDGAHFSDHFLVQLVRGVDLLNSFTYARSSVRSILSNQDPWLDDNGDGVFDLATDGLLARERGFGQKNRLDDDELPPYIGQVLAPEAINNYSGVIRAQVLENQEIDEVYAVVYSPSYTPPEDGEELVIEPQSAVLLAPIGDNWYSGEYTGFTEPGKYRIAVYADDRAGLKSLPVVVEFVNGSSIYLPQVSR